MGGVFPCRFQKSIQLKEGQGADPQEHDTLIFFSLLRISKQARKIDLGKTRIFILAEPLNPWEKREKLRWIQEGFIKITV